MISSWFTQTEAFLLHEIVALLDRLARTRVLDPRGLSYAEFLVAMAVREMPRPTHGQVGELLDMSKSLVSQRVAGLVAKNMVIQHRDPENRRQVRLELTASGAATLEQIYAELARSAGRIFDVLGPERGRFNGDLLRVLDALAKAEAPIHEPFVEPPR